MKNIITKLAHDENGFIVSAELVLIATIAVLSLGVGLAEVSYNINEELEDIGAAFAQLNQSYEFRMASGTKGDMADSIYVDHNDEGESEWDITCNNDLACDSMGEVGSGL